MVYGAAILKELMVTATPPTHTHTHTHTRTHTHALAQARTRVLTNIRSITFSAKKSILAFFDKTMNMHSLISAVVLVVVVHVAIS